MKTEPRWGRRFRLPGRSEGRSRHRLVVLDHNVGRTNAAPLNPEHPTNRIRDVHTTACRVMAVFEMVNVSVRTLSHS